LLFSFREDARRSLGVRKKKPEKLSKTRKKHHPAVIRRPKRSAEEALELIAAPKIETTKIVFQGERTTRRSTRGKGHAPV